jgi:hypothetical protein
MKNSYILQTALIALLFSGCSALFTVQDTQQSGSSNQSVQSNNQIAQATHAAENQADANPASAFANLESEGTNLPMERSTAQQTNAVCPIPDKPCKHKDKEFAEWELSFRLPAKIIPNKTYSSATFYAVMLKTYQSQEDCDGGEFIEALEEERKEMQKLEPKRKVFAAFACPNMDAVNYEFEGRWDKAKEVELIGNFIAIYAGTSAEESEVLRRSMRDEYPQAVVKRMAVNWERIEQ